MYYQVISQCVQMLKNLESWPSWPAASRPT